MLSFVLKLALPSIATGTFSELKKIARVTHIFKDGDKSILPVIARVVDNLVAN